MFIKKCVCISSYCYDEANISLKIMISALRIMLGNTAILWEKRKYVEQNKYEFFD